jgi:hypothetical protein
MVNLQSKLIDLSPENAPESHALKIRLYLTISKVQTALHENEVPRQTSFET